MKKMRYLMIVLTLTACTGLVQAVTVNNYSFEVDGVIAGAPTDWTADGTELGVDTVGVGVTDGTYAVWMGNDTTLYQNTSVVIASAGASYTLQVDVKNDWNANPQIILYYDDAGSHTPLGEAHYLADAFPPADGFNEGEKWAEPQLLELTVVTTSTSVGKTLGVELAIQNGAGNHWAHYDNVRLVSNTVTLVSPANNADLVPKDADLEWTVAPTVEKVDLYLGLEDDPNLTLDPLLLVTDIPATTTSYSPTLDYSTPYFWKVVAYEPNTPSGYITTDSGAWSFTTAGPSPVIQLMTPYAQSVSAGTSSTTITASGVNLEFYQWYKDGAPLSDGADYTGTDEATLTILDVQLADEGVYSCEVSNSLSVDTDTATAVVVTERLMSWWKLDGNLNDSVLEVEPDADWVFDGVVDPKTEFTTDDSGIDGGNSLALTIDDPNCPLVPIAGTEEFFNFYEDTFTVSAWIRTTYVNDSAWPAVVSKQPIEGSGYVVALDGESETLTEIHGTRIYSNGPVVADGQWHMLTLTYDGSVQRVYVDGEYQATSSATATDASDNTAPVVLAAWDLNSTDADFEGNIDNVKIYSYAMTSTEVGEEYVATNPNVDYVCNWELPDLVYDSNGDCKVDLVDLADFAAKWLDCNRIPASACLD